jgi:predicted PurR-regulated permease PerM
MLQNVQESSILRLLLIGMAAVVIAAGLRLFALVLGPAIMAVFLALLCVPLYQWLQRKGLGAGAALLLLALLLLVIFIGLGWLVVVSFQVLAQTLPEYTANMQAQVSQISDQLAQLGVSGEGVEAVGNTAVSAIVTLAASVLGTAVALVTNALIILVLLIFLVAESPRYPARLRRGLGPESDMIAKVRAFRGSLVYYFLARIKVNLITSAGILIMLLVAGIDAAPLWAVLAFFLSFVPYFGIVIAMIPALVLGFAQYGLGMLALLTIGYTIINQVAEQILAPKIIASEVSLSPALTFFTLFFWGWLFGFMGVLLVVPLTVLIIMLLAGYPETSWLATLAVAEKGGPEKSPVSEAPRIDDSHQHLP